MCVSWEATSATVSRVRCLTLSLSSHSLKATFKYKVSPQTASSSTCNSPTEHHHYLLKGSRSFREISGVVFINPIPPFLIGCPQIAFTPPPPPSGFKAFFPPPPHVRQVHPHHAPHPNIAIYMLTRFTYSCHNDQITKC